jgi:hypothetical protein
MPTYRLWTFPKYSFTWLVRGVLSTFPWVWCWFPALAVEARYKRESSLPPREWECGEMCVMGWVNLWMRWVKTWWTITKLLMNLHRNATAIYRPFALPLISLTTKPTQSIGWEPVASTNRTDNCSARLDVIYNDDNKDLRIRNWWSRFYTQVWLRRSSLRPLTFYANSDDCPWRRSLHPLMRYIDSNKESEDFPSRKSWIVSQSH